MPRTRRRGPKSEVLTIWGEWVDTIAAILCTDYEEIAAHTDEPRMHPSTISRQTRKVDGPTRDTVVRVWDAFVAIAKERDQHMNGRKHSYSDLINHVTRDGFYNGGGIVSEFQQELSHTRLRALQVYLDLLQENNQKEQIIALLEEQIAQLTQEIKQLRP